MTAPPPRRGTAERLAARNACRLTTGELSPGAMSQSDLLAAIGAATTYGLGPALYSRLRGSGHTGTDPAWRGLASDYRQCAARYLMLRSAFGRLQTALSAAGIPTIWLKGIALAHTIHSDPASRPMADLDLLVPAQQHRDAVEVVRSAGFESPLSPEFGVVGESGHHIGLQDSAPGGVNAEVHRALALGSGSMHGSDDLTWFWDRTLSVSAGPLSFLTLTPEAHLAYLSAHGLIHHSEDEFSLLRYLDIHLLLARYPNLDWHDAISGAVRHGWGLALRRTLALATDWFGSAVPAAATSELAQALATTSLRQFERPRRHIFNGATAALDTRAMVGTGRWLAILARLLAPTPEYMQWRYSPSGRLALAGAYVRRWSQLPALVAPVFATSARRGLESARRTLAGRRTPD